MLTEQNKKKISLSLFLASSLSIFLIFLFFSPEKNQVIALVNDERIYKKDVKEELLSMFPGGDPKTFQVERLPKNVLESVSKSIYVKKKIYNNAKDSAVFHDDAIRDQIHRFSKNLITEKFIDSLLSKRVKKKDVRQRYLEISDNMKDARQYNISHILVKTKYQAGKIVNKLKRRQSFAKLAQRYSIDTKTNRQKGNLGYFALENMKKEFLDHILQMKKNDFSQPIKTDAGWHVVKLLDIKEYELEPFEKVEHSIVESLKKEHLNELFLDIASEADVKILIDI